MKTECNVIIDLLPLYVEDMVSPESKQLIEEHLSECQKCRGELERLKGGEALAVIEQKPESKTDEAKPFKKIMQRAKRQSYALSYPIVILAVFLGFSWTSDGNLMYNSLLMPLVGIFAYIIFGWRSVYKMPLLLLLIDTFVCITGLVELDLYSAFIWTLIYSLFVLVGIAIALLLHFALRKEHKNEN